MSRLLLATFTVGVSATLVASTSADLLTIRGIAPEKSILVVGADNLEQTKARFNHTPLGEWWSSDEVQKASKDMREKMEKGLGDWTQDLGVAREDVTWPASFGAAIFFEKNEDSGLDDPAFVAFMDWGKDAEKFGKLYDAATTKLEKDKPADMPFKIEDVKGHRVYVFEQPKPEEMKDAQGNKIPEPEGPFDALKLCVTRDGGRLLVAGGLTTMNNLIAKVDGDKAKSVGDNADFKGSLELVGGTPDIYFALLTERAMELMMRMSPEMMFFVSGVAGVFPAVFGEIRGWSLGVALDTKSAPLVQSVGMYAPAGKQGIWTLLGSLPVEKAPTVVPVDALSYGRLNIKFPEVPNVIEDILAKLPEGPAQMLKQQLEPMMPSLKATFGALGSTMHFWNNGVQDAEQGAPPMLAIPTTDPKQAQTLIETLGGGAVRPRDFLGNTIYATEDGEEPAFGFSSQFMFMSTTSEVEKALRAVGAKNEASISSDPVYQSAATAWGSEELVGYGYSNSIAMLESLESLTEGADAMPVDVGMPGAEDLEMFKPVLKAELLKKYFGATVWKVRSTKSGFTGDFLVLPATKTDAKKN